MTLTAAQLATLKADILADPTLNAFPNNSDGSSAMAAVYNAPASPDFIVWATAVPVGVIYDAITWANLTPNDAPDGTQLWENRALACQGKQFNVQIMLQGQATINGARANVRAGLQDALTGVPSGTSGAPRQAGWTSVQTALQRKATRFEKLFATGTGSVAVPAVLVLEGSVGYQDLDQARNG